MRTPFLCKLDSITAIARGFTNICFCSELLDCNTSHKLLISIEFPNIFRWKSAKLACGFYLGAIPPNVPYLSDLRYGINGKLEGGLRNHMVNCGGGLQNLKLGFGDLPSIYIIFSLPLH